jgi:polyisoprenyl-teichoic acid--peptidoglycan teichoic acid transferase
MMIEKTMKVLSFIFFIGILLFIGYLCMKLFVWDDFYQERERRDEFLSEFWDVEPNDPKNPEGNHLNEEVYNRPFTVLLMGVDTDNAKVGRSDTMILATVEPEKEKISLLSIPRDTRVKIYNRGMEKINHSYAYGLESAIYTVEDYLQVPVDFYATIDFKGFRGLVDEIGGLEVDVERKISFPDRITHQHFTLNPGVQHLNGMQTLNYSRYRYGPDGDFGRMRRQVQVIKALADQTADIRNIPKLKGILDVLGENFRTDINLTELVKIMLNLHNISGENIERIEMNGYSSTIGGVSYVIVEEQERLRIQTKLENILKGKTGE